ncbi:golgin subfamily A member 6-like protein 22 [Centroberyx affinis]|uniref:golgin subfamily A member 6-like protein 22 n=1 Tax=Centroberyx affinis TaxID=166261 RepID=UPI003A5BB9DC
MSGTSPSPAGIPPAGPGTIPTNNFIPGSGAPQHDTYSPAFLENFYEGLRRQVANASITSAANRARRQPFPAPVANHQLTERDRKINNRQQTTETDITKVNCETRTGSSEKSSPSVTLYNPAQETVEMSGTSPSPAGIPPAGPGTIPTNNFIPGSGAPQHDTYSPAFLANFYEGLRRQVANASITSAANRARCQPFPAPVANHQLTERDRKIQILTDKLMFERQHSSQQIVALRTTIEDQSEMILELQTENAHLRSFKCRAKVNSKMAREIMVDQKAALQDLERWQEKAKKLEKELRTRERTSNLVKCLNQLLVGLFERYLSENNNHQAMADLRLELKKFQDQMEELATDAGEERLEPTKDSHTEEDGRAKSWKDVIQQERGREERAREEREREEKEREERERQERMREEKEREERERQERMREEKEREEREREERERQERMREEKEREERERQERMREEKEREERERKERERQERMREEKEREERERQERMREEKEREEKEREERERQERMREEKEREERERQERMREEKEREERENEERKREEQERNEREREAREREAREKREREEREREEREETLESTDDSKEREREERAREGREREERKREERERKERERKEREETLESTDDSSQTEEDSSMADSWKDVIQEERGREERKREERREREERKMEKRERKERERQEREERKMEKRESEEREREESEREERKTEKRESEERESEERKTEKREREERERREEEEEKKISSSQSEPEGRGDGQKAGQQQKTEEEEKALNPEAERKVLMLQKQKTIKGRLERQRKMGIEPPPHIKKVVEERMKEQRRKEEEERLERERKLKEEETQRDLEQRRQMHERQNRMFAEEEARGRKALLEAREAERMETESWNFKRKSRSNADAIAATYEAEDYMHECDDPECKRKKEKAKEKRRQLLLKEEKRSKKENEWRAKLRQKALKEDESDDSDESD